MMKPVKIFISLLLFLTTVSSYSQKYQFLQYNLEEGLSHPFVYSINEDKHGFLWFSTGEGLCRFDGFQFEKCASDDSLTNGYVTVSYRDVQDNLWFGHNSGELTRYDGKYFEKVPVDEYTDGTINSIIEDKDDNIIIATQNKGLIRYSKDQVIDTFRIAFKNKLINSIQFASDDVLLAGIHDGLYVYKYSAEDGFQLLSKFPELEFIAITSIYKSKTEGYFWIGTEDNGFWLLQQKENDFSAYELSNFSEKFDLQYENVQSFHEDDQNHLWISTFGNGIYKLMAKEDDQISYNSVTHYNTDNGLTNNFIKQVFQDWEGNTWIATYGNGVAFSKDDAFTFHYDNIESLGSDITAVAQDDQYIWLGGRSLLVRVNRATEELVSFDITKGLPDDNIVALFLDKSSNLWIGSNKSGLYQIVKGSNRVTQLYKSANSLENNINSITGNDEFIFVATKAGVNSFDLNTGQRILYSTRDGLPHNNIRNVFIDSKGEPWIATINNGIYNLFSDSSLVYIENAKLEFTAIAEDQNGDLWAATYGEGVCKFSEDTILYIFSSDHGLRSSYCYDIIADDQGRVWIGHRMGFSTINTETYEINTYSKDAGISGDVNYNAALKQDDGVLLFGTTQGLVRFDPAKERINDSPPRINIKSVVFSDDLVDHTKPILLPYNIYKLKIDFVGLSYRNAANVNYQYMLEGYDLEWSDITTAKTLTYPRIENGSYTFLLKACNSDGYCTEDPLSFEIKIKAPIWARWWFITSAILIGLAVIFIIVKYREKKQKELQDYLETELAKRTQEVMDQRDLLERKNRDITDSINYAQRIQKSILPSVEFLNQIFGGSFVFYQPRDIVSGDFYWFDRVNEDKLLIVCADSTGHGVPGAFMSMIGTTLIKDICLRGDINSPADVLHELDKELQGTLNRNVGAERANDGMDIIVCEIDINTYYMRFSSAMRPIILYKDNDLQYVKGNKASIGGTQDENKRFENIGFQLNKGDIIYMFSDGYPDQFGGPRGKKFKLERLKNMLADVCEKPMDNQLSYINETFNSWRGQLGQVDDVLFMGVKI